MKISDRITLFIVLIALLSFLIYIINRVIPEASLFVSSEETGANVEKWIRYADTSTESIIFSYKNKYDNQIYVIQVPIELQASIDE